LHRREYLYSDRINATDVAWEAIPRAYQKASSGGTLPAHARQIFYAARDEIQRQTGRPLDSVYFTQNLLPTFIAKNPKLTKDWWVVYDPRGHLIEPHTDTSIPIGTLEVDEYLREVANHEPGDIETNSFSVRFPTKGPKNRFSAVLYIEKEGFNPLFKQVKLAERYDLAIMSTKGQSVVAARRLVDELCHGDVPLLVLHDLDKDGFSISQNLTSVSYAAEESGRIRYQFRHQVNVIDMGLRLEHVKKWELQAEQVRFRGCFDFDSIATDEEKEFLRGNQRVELNAFSSGDFIAWIEGLLNEHGIEKVVPDHDTIEQAYRRAFQVAYINERLVEFREEASKAAEAAKLPRELAPQIRKTIKENPEIAWDAALAVIAAGQVDETIKKNGDGGLASHRRQSRVIDEV
jgi:hypothetical protein